MEKDDLTVVKHIGAVRMKVLNEAGIHTLEALYHTPLESLAGIKNIGERYAGLIKEAVAAVYTAPPAPETSAVTENPPDEEKAAVPVDDKLNRRVKKLNKALGKADEKLKPLGKKKLLTPYVAYKKGAKKLKRRLDGATCAEAALSEKMRKKIIKRSGALCATIKSIEKKPKKKTYTALHQEIQSFARMLRQSGR